MATISAAEMLHYIPSPPVLIPDFSGQNPHLGDIISAHRVETRQGDNYQIVTLGYTTINDPTRQGEQGARFHTITTKDFARVTTQEIDAALILPEGNPELMRRFALEAHALICYAHQLVDITPETNGQLQELFNTITLNTDADVTSALADMRGVLLGSLFIQDTPTIEAIRKKLEIE